MVLYHLTVSKSTNAWVAVADGLYLIGLTFSPDGSYAYVTDTGLSQGLFGQNYTRPASM